MNSRNFLSWLLVLLAVCGLALAGFSAGVVTAACEWGCVSGNYWGESHIIDWEIHVHDPYYGIILEIPHGKALEAVGESWWFQDEPNGPSCNGSVNVACRYVYDDVSFDTPCTYFDELATIDWPTFDDDDFDAESPISSFSVPGCNTCT